jgi:MFS family permease
LESHPENKRVLIKPRLFYGLIIVAAIFCIHLISYGLSDSFGVFINPWMNDFGWNRAVISGAYSLAFMMSGIMGIVMGIITDRYSPRIALSICAVCLGTGYILISSMHVLWQLYVFYGLLFGTGMSGIWAPMLSLISRWFTSKRGLVTGIVVSGGGLGAFIGPPVITWLVSTYNWVNATLILGIFVLIGVLLAAQFLKLDPSSVGQKPYREMNTLSQNPASSSRDFSLKEALHTTQFWTIFFMFFCLSFYTFSILVHYVPHLIQLGIPAYNAAYILSTISGVSILGNFVMGRVGDKLGPKKIFIISFVLMAAAIFWLVQAREIWELYFFSIVFGFNHGGNATAQAPLAARIFGLKAHGTIFAVIAFGFTTGGAVGPFVTGYIFDLTGVYQTAFIICGAVGILGLILAAILKPTRRIITEI